MILRDGLTLSNGLEVVGIEDDVAFKNVRSDDNSEDEIMAFSSEKQLGDAPSNNGDISLNHQQVTDELADSGDDDIASNALSVNSTRRRLRMIIDFEEDDE